MKETIDQDEESNSENESYEVQESNSENESYEVQERVENEDNEEEKSKPLIPTKGSKIRYRMKDSDTYEEAKVLGKAGKATGKK